MKGSLRGSKRAICMKSKEIYEIGPALFYNKCKTVTHAQLKSNATISLPISIKNIRSPNGGGFGLVVLQSQGGWGEGGAKKEIV